MSKELTINATMTFQRGTVSEIFSSTSLLVDVASDSYVKRILPVTEVRTLISTTGIDAPGFALFKNTGDVQVALATSNNGNPFALMNPGESCGPFRIGSAVYVYTVLVGEETDPGQIQYLLLSE